MEEFMANWKELKIWSWYMKDLKGNSLKESMTNLENKYLHTNGKKLRLALTFLRKQLKKVHKVLVKKMTKNEVVFPSRLI